MAGSRGNDTNGPSDRPPASVASPPTFRSRTDPGLGAARSKSPVRPSSSWRLAMVDFSLVTAAKRIIEEALSVVPGEIVTVVVDRERVALANALMDAAHERKARPTLLILEDLGVRPFPHLPKEIQTQLRSSQASVFLAGFNASERQMREEFVALVPALGLRHAHMIGLSRKSLCSGFSADPQRIADAARAVRTRLRGNSVLRVHSSLGTDLTVHCEPTHRWIEHSGVIRPGKWENLPAGEIITSPGEVRGVFICNASMSESFGERYGFLRDNPVRLVIDGGVVRSVFCSDSRIEREIKSWMMSGDRLERVGLVSLGTNVGMRDPVGEILSDQNLPGLHLSLGATWPELTGASWTTQGQLMLAAAYSDVDLDGIPIIRSGRYLDLK